MQRLELLATTISNTVSSNNSKLIVERKDRVATIWLNSPKDLNCLSVSMASSIK